MIFPNILRNVEVCTFESRWNISVVVFNSFTFYVAVFKTGDDLYTRE